MNYPQYPMPWRTLSRLAASIILLKPLNFRNEALYSVGYITRSGALTMRISGQENIPSGGPCLLTINHYTRPGFNSWWIALAASAALPADIHWITAAAWQFEGQNYLRPLSAITGWVFTRLARVYGFTPMPPMPPRPWEVQARAQAIRQVIEAARQTPPPIIGLAPEGGDEAGGVLGPTPEGVGRFILLLAERGYPIVPAGFHEEDSSLCLSFGAPYQLSLPPGLSSTDKDHQAAQMVMRAIAAQLPARLRGEYQ